MVVAVILFRLFPNSEAVAGAATSGVGWRVFFNLGGAVALALVFFVALTGSMIFFAPRAVQVYLAFQQGGVAPPGAKDGRFELLYRRTPFPQGRVLVQEGSATVQDLPFWATKLVVNDVKGMWHVTAKQDAGEGAPWVFDIVNGEVTILMVEKPPGGDPLPERDDVKALLEKRGLGEKEALKTGTFTKHQVSLNIENAADRAITFLACDCAAVYGAGDVDDKGRLWTWRKDERAIPVGGV